MRIENELATKMRSAAEEMPVRRLSVDDLVARGGRSLTVRRFVVAGAVAVLGVFGFLAADRVVSTQEVDDFGPETNGGPLATDYQDIEERALRFSELVERGDAQASWGMLSTRAQQAIGSYARWEKDDSKDAEAFFGWIHRSDAELFVTPSLLFDDRSVYTVTALAPTEDDGTGLLETLSLRVVGEEIMIDSDIDNSVMPTPESPFFMAGCQGDGCEDIADYRPSISYDSKLSFTLEPSELVKDVVFSLGGDRTMVDADLEAVGDDGVRATARLGRVDAPRDTFLNIIIQLSGGEVESWGYRVIYEDGT